MEFKERKFSSMERGRCDELIEILEQELSRIRQMIIDGDKVSKINRNLVYATKHTETMLGAISCINTARIMSEKEDES